MLKQIIAIAWRRKKANSLILIELLVAFLVLVAVSAVLIYHWHLYQKPLGFHYLNTLAIGVGKEAGSEERGAMILQMLAQQPEVEAAHALTIGAFVNAHWNGQVSYGKKEILTERNAATDGALPAFGLTLLAGRWFGPEDAGLPYEAVVINQNLKQQLFGDEDALGQQIFGGDKRAGAQKVHRVVGVFEDFRQKGEFTDSNAYMFSRLDLSDPKAWYHSLVLVLKPDAPIEFEQKLLGLLNNAAPAWDFNIQSWVQLRQAQISEQVKPLILVAIVVAALMLMVCFGLFGVLWQNVTRRTAEIGLRRAVGATGSSVQGLIMAELVVFALLAVVVGTLLAIQVPLLGVFEGFTWLLFIQSTLLSAVVICLLTAVCAYYPGRMAAKYDPAYALHFE